MSLITDWLQDTEMRKGSSSNRKLDWQRNENKGWAAKKKKANTNQSNTKTKIINTYSLWDQTCVQEDSSTLCNPAIVSAGCKWLPNCRKNFIQNKTNILESPPLFLLFVLNIYWMNRAEKQ